MKRNNKNILNRPDLSLLWRLSMLSLTEQRAICTLYSFYHHIDSITRNTASTKQKKELIAVWRQELDNIYDKKTPASKIGRSIYKNCMRFHLPKEDLISILDSVEMDLPQPLKAPSLKKLEQYCQGMACAPSSMLLRILGCKDEALINELSQNLGQAVQITNILRDVRDDAEAGRLYIPHDFLKKAGIDTTSPKEVIVNKNLTLARQELASVAEKKYEKTFDLISRLDKKTARNIKVLLYIYKRYFDLMNNRGWEIISPKPKITKLSKLFLVLKAFSGK